MPEIRVIQSREPKRHQPKTHPHATIGKRLADEYTYASTLLVICWDQWGDDLDEDGRVRFLSWHPSTLRMELNQTFGAEVTQGNFDRLMAAIAIVTTDLFFKNVHRFIQLCNVLAGSEFDPTTFDPATVAECAWGITEGLLLMPPDEEDPEPFDDDIRRYVGYMLKSEGFVTPPDILKIALDADDMARVQGDHGDDPELLAEIRQRQSVLCKEIEALLREGVVELIMQLKSLHLRNGETKELEKRLSDMLKAL